jgi:hypothetical protein
VPEEAESLHQRARQAGERGDHKNAILLLEQHRDLRRAGRTPFTT